MTPKSLFRTVCTAHRSPLGWPGGRSGKKLRRSCAQKPKRAHVRQSARASSGSLRQQLKKQRLQKWGLLRRCAPIGPLAMCPGVGLTCGQAPCPHKFPEKKDRGGHLLLEIAESVQHAWLLHQLVEQLECLQRRAVALLDTARRLPKEKNVASDRGQQ